MASYKKPPIIEPLMTFQEFQESEYQRELQFFYESGGMIAHEELTDEPYDFLESLH